MSDKPTAEQLAAEDAVWDEISARKAAQISAYLAATESRGAFGKLEGEGPPSDPPYPVKGLEAEEAWGRHEPSPCEECGELACRCEGSPRWKDEHIALLDWLSDYEDDFPLLREAIDRRHEVYGQTDFRDFLREAMHLHELRAARGAHGEDRARGRRGSLGDQGDVK